MSLLVGRADQDQGSKARLELLEYTCDGATRLTDGRSTQSVSTARDRIQDARLVFATTVGAGLGLLRSQRFDSVVVLDAARQTEPSTLIALTKGCKRAILVGDHAQDGPPVAKLTAAPGVGVSLFERLYTTAESSGIARVMLDTQYQMHIGVSAFCSEEFYDGKVLPDLNDTILVGSSWSWAAQDKMAFVQCHAPEDLGDRSKVNEGQAKVCRNICDRLRAWTVRPLDSTGRSTRSATVMIVTTSTRQASLLRTMIPDGDVRTVEEQSGRSADLVVFVTVRCNAHHDLGDLRDGWQVQAVLTGAKAGLIIVGDKETLRGAGDTSNGIWSRLIDRCTDMDIDQLSADQLERQK